jgi:hypothetical protein
LPIGNDKIGKRRQGVGDRRQGEKEILFMLGFRKKDEITGC